MPYIPLWGIVLIMLTLATGIVLVVLSAARSRCVESKPSRAVEVKIRD